MRALASEIAAHMWQWTPETVYLGGGTPSLMEPEDLRKLLDAVPGRPWQEATLEAAPGTLNAARIEAWHKAGINRVSLGVQSFAARELARTGRKHTAEIVAKEVGELRAANLTNINIDLIAGLAGQTGESWQESLEWIERLAPPHVSVYMLEVDDDSRLGRELLAGGARYGAQEVPSEEAIVEFYETACECLARLGLEQYEISNFARPGCESRHNLKYWRLEPYAGFGADAHSFDGSTRSRNTESLADYVRAWKAGESAVAEVSPAQVAEERFYVGLRLREGIRLSAAEWRRFGGPIHRFLQDCLLSLEDGTLRLTRRGVLFSNEVFAGFLGARDHDGACSDSSHWLSRGAMRGP